MLSPLAHDTYNLICSDVNNYGFDINRRALALLGLKDERLSVFATNYDCAVSLDNVQQ